MTKFLECMCKSPNVSAACAAAGVSRRTVYHARKRNLQFKALWDEAQQIAIDRWEAEGERRAFQGIERIKYDRNGVMMQKERVFSDKLADTYLKAYRGEKFREKDASVNVQIGIAFSMNGPPPKGIKLDANMCNISATESAEEPKTLDIEEESTD